MSETERTTSKYPALEVPEFRSGIPAHLITKLTEQERYLVETLNRLEQQSTWCVEHAKLSHAANIDADLRLQSVEQWKSAITGKVGIFLWLLTITIPMLIKVGIDILFKK